MTAPVPQSAPIVTLTINPALDVSTATEQVEPEHKLRCGPSRTDAGGGGVNVSRVIHRLGGQSVAIYAVGGPTGHAYRQLLEADGIIGRAIGIEGSTRENITIDELSTGRQFRFVLQGPHLTSDEWGECLAATLRAMTPGGYVVASGSLAPACPTTSTRASRGRRRPTGCAASWMPRGRRSPPPSPRACTS